MKIDFYNYLKVKIFVKFIWNSYAEVFFRNETFRSL